MTEIYILLDGILYNAIGLFFVALGILVLIRHTGFPDLTVDGSFTFGAVVFAMILTHSSSLVAAVLMCVLAGSLAGLATAAINQWLGVTKIVSSVVSMTIFMLISPYVAGSATVGLLKVDPVIGFLRTLDQSISQGLGIVGYSLHYSEVMFWSVVGLMCAFALYRFMRSSLGTRLRYAGSSSSPSMISVKVLSGYTIFGLMVGNGLVALGGSIEAVRRGAFTANMGLGTILIGLTILILGEALLKIWLKRDYLRLHEQLLAVLVGLFAYSLLLQIILRLGVETVDLKLMTTFMLLIVLSFAGRFFPNSGRLF